MTRPSSRPVHKDGELKETKRLGIKKAGTEPIFRRSFPKKDPFTITVDFLEEFNRILHCYTLSEMNGIRSVTEAVYTLKSVHNVI